MIHSVSDKKRQEQTNTAIESAFTTLYFHHELYPEDPVLTEESEDADKFEIILSEPVKF